MKQNIGQTNLTDHTVAVFATHVEAETAIKSLNSGGYEMRNLSIIGQNYETVEQPFGFVNTGQRMLAWGKFGAFWGTIWGLLFGSAMLIVPGVGGILFAGWIVAGLEGALVGGGLAALGGALASTGIPENSVINYEKMLKAGSFIVIAHGNEADIQVAREVLKGASATQIDNYSTIMKEVAATR